MTTSRLSYASSPESDLELSPGPSTALSLGNLPQLVKASSDPSIATNQDNLDRDRDIIGDGLPPPYTIPYDFGNPPPNRRQTMDTSKYVGYAAGPSIVGGVAIPAAASARPQSLYGINAPDLPPRIDRQSKPGPGDMPPPASRTSSSSGTLGRSAQERLFGKATVCDDVQAEYISRTVGDSIERQHASLERPACLNSAIGGSPGGKASGPPHQNGSSYDSVSSYDSYNTAAQLTLQNLGRLGPNAPDDLKSVPNVNGRQLPASGLNPVASEYAKSTHDHRNFVGANDLNRQSSPGRPQYHEMNSTRNIDPRIGPPQRPSNLSLEGSPRKHIVETKTDYGKYSRNNSTTQADYSKLPKMVVPAQNINSNNGVATNGSGGPFKPVPPPKPKNYRPPMQGGQHGTTGHAWENGEPGSPRSPNGFFYPQTSSHHHYAQQTPGSQHHGPNGSTPQPTYGTNNTSNSGSNGTYSQQPQYPSTNGYNGSSSHHYNGGSGTGPYIAPHRGMPPSIGNIPPHTPERQALDLAGSREQRGSAFELYRKPQIGAVGHHHNLSELEPYEQQRYGDYYAMPPGLPNHRARPRHPENTDNAYYDYERQQCRQALHPQIQCYDQNGVSAGALSTPQPPPLPPYKAKKKSVLKSPLVALKNALMKTTRPLRRMNSMVEPERKPKSALKRQHSMLERGMQRPLHYPDEYPIYPVGFEDRYDGATPGPVIRMSARDQYYHGQQQQQYAYHQQQQRRYGYSYPQQDVLNSTYKNLENEDIYSNLPQGARRARDRYVDYHGYGHDDLYANRALIDLERRQAEAAAVAMGRKIVRRHSATTADHALQRRPPAYPPYEQNDIYQSKQGAFMLDAQRRAPHSEVMQRRRFYPGAANELGGDMPPQELIYQSRRELQRELQRSHLQQSKREMQERITQGKLEMEREFSPYSSSQSERDDRSEPSEAIYQTRRETKEDPLRTRAQLRDQIYQTRREALDSMAEPIYVSKRDTGRPEPIYESKEESILQRGENETDEKKEGKGEITVVEINQDEEGLSRSDLQRSLDTVIENTQRRAPLEQSEEDDELLMDNRANETATEETDNSRLNQGMLQNTVPDTHDMSDDVFEEPAKLTPSRPLTSRSIRAPFHISNMLKLTAPPPPPPPNAVESPTTFTETTASAVGDSCTSIETHYTSQASLPVGPPNATSTPYPSNMSLPIAGPVPTAAPAAASVPGVGSFPVMPREPTTTRGIFDDAGGTLADNVWNVSLQIPAGAIAAGVRQEVYFTVSDPRMGEAVGGPPLDMENGETMLSPLVMCGPQGLEFLVPVTLNIPHCAGRTASLGLALKATDSEKNIHTEWDNIDLPSNAAAHTVSVKVDHF